MMKYITLESLKSDEIQSFVDVWKPCSFQKEVELFYEGQSLHVGYVLLEGSLKLYRKGSMLHQVPKNTLIGIKDLMGGRKLKVSGRVAPDSKLCVIDKTTVFELLESAEGTPFFKSYL